MLHRFVEFIQPFAASLGGPGLALLAFLDSSFLTFPEVPDFLLVWMVIQHPGRWPFYAFMATLGSVLGCFAIYFVARKSGEAMLQRGFKASTLSRAMAAIRRYGMVALIVPSILPPPTPFKVFVILAGVSGISPARFGVAMLVGRGLRYVVEALLAYRYGEAAMRYMNQNVAQITLWLGALAVVGAIGFLIWRWRARSAKG